MALLIEALDIRISYQKSNPTAMEFVMLLPKTRLRVNK